MFSHNKYNSVKTHTSKIFSMAVIIAMMFFSAFWSSEIQAGTPRRPSNTQTLRPMSSPLDSISLMHLLDSLIVPGLGKYHIPGMVIAIVHDSTIVLAKGYGYADIERKIPFDPDSTVIRIASVSKLFTGTCMITFVSSYNIKRGE
jgi:CubicO group peptidase (beta-lactamase class C family)